MRFGIVGGGISGLSAAFYLRKAHPSSKITLIESSNRVGGWLKTINHNGQLFETGPRTIRPNGEAGRNTLELIEELGIQDSILSVEKSSVSAKNRYILIDDRVTLLPNSLVKFLKPPFLSLVPQLLREPFISSTAQSDESVDAFFKRRTGDRVANLLISSMVHGIYAGDTQKLSMRSAFKEIWNGEQTHGSVFKSLLKKPSENQKISVYSLKNGIETLSDALYANLKSTVEIVFNCEIESVEIGNSVLLNRTKTMEFDRVFFAIPAHKLANINGMPFKSELSSIPYVDVAVVNLAFDINSFAFPGFGYLVPKIANSKLLGVVFDSCSTPELDSGNIKRFTAMIKGSGRDFDYLQYALNKIEQHLHIPKSKLVTSLVSLHEKCIPNYAVGHFCTTSKIEKSLENSPIKIIGSCFNGVSVNDCILDSKIKSRI